MSKQPYSLNSEGFINVTADGLSRKIILLIHNIYIGLNIVSRVYILRVVI